jgi:ATP-binding cassette subfamily F protein 3
LAAKKAAKAAKKAAETASSASATTTTSATTNTADTSTDQTPASDDPVTAGDASSEPEIVAYSQQSRFHRETFDANTTDIDIKGVNISIGSKDILVDANLRLKAGFKYGMVGQNGVGKSGECSICWLCILADTNVFGWTVLMSVLGNNMLIGLPQNVRFLHVKQLEEFAPGRTILQEVLEADSERVRVIQEAKGAFLSGPPRLL